MTIGQFGNGIRQYFHADPQPFLWVYGLIIFKRVMIDVLYLEEWLSDKPNYNPDNSLQQNITNIFGESAAKWVEATL